MKPKKSTVCTFCGKELLNTGFISLFELANPDGITLCSYKCVSGYVKDKKEHNPLSYFEEIASWISSRTGIDCSDDQFKELYRNSVKASASGQVVCLRKSANKTWNATPLKHKTPQ